MNINKNKSICKGLSLSKIIFPAVGLFLVTTETGCIRSANQLGMLEKSNKKSLSTSCLESNNNKEEYTWINTDRCSRAFEKLPISVKKIYSYATKFVIRLPKLPDNPQTNFLNPIDNSVQVAKFDGQSVVILNGLNEEGVKKMVAKIIELNLNSIDLSNRGINVVQNLKKLFEFTKEEKMDIYDSNLAYVTNNLTKIDNCGVNNDWYGLYRRNDQQNNKPCKAGFISGKIAFSGTSTVTPQIFENGVVIVEQEGAIRAIQPNIFIATHKYSDGTDITIESLPKLDA